MIRFTLLQARLQIILALLGLSLVGIVLALTAQDISDAVKQCGANSSTCDSIGQVLPQQYAQLYLLLHALVLITPGLIGVFWGAPLVSREFNDATHRLVWSQSVTRTRWITTKLVSIGLLAMAVAALLSWMVGAWARDVGEFATFEARGVVPVAHTAFAFVVGVTIGIFTKRIVPAMVVTLVVVVVCSIGGSHVRPHLVTPYERTTTVDGDSVQQGAVTGNQIRLMPTAPKIPNALVVSTKFVGKDGTASSLEFDADTAGPCAGLLSQTSRDRVSSENSVQIAEEFASAQSSCYVAIDADYDIRTTYQPSSRYWTLQWIESGLYIALALALSAISIRCVRRHPV